MKDSDTIETKREIKFRAWDKVQGGMYQVIALGMYSNEAVGADRCREIGKDCALMQYTGLKDKSGKEIYEGDVIEWTHKPSDVTGRSLVSYHEPFCRFHFVSLSSGGFQAIGDTDFEYRVLGNIYENPDLLGKPATDAPKDRIPCNDGDEDIEPEVTHFGGTAGEGAGY